MKKTDFVAYIGNNPLDIYNALVATVGGISGYRLPLFEHCNTTFLSRVALALQKAYLESSVIRQTIPKGIPL
jgi:hypothetical protein